MDVVHAATQALVQYDTSLGRQVIRDALSAGKHPTNRAAGAWALGALRVKSATKLLVDVAIRLDEATEVRAEAAEALGYMGNPTPVEPLIRLLGDPNAQIRCEAAFSLGNLGDQRALPFLERLATDDTPCKNLGRLGDVAKEAARTIRMIQPSANRSRRLRQGREQRRAQKEPD